MSAIHAVDFGLDFLCASGGERGAQEEFRPVGRPHLRRVELLSRALRHVEVPLIDLTYERPPGRPPGQHLWRREALAGPPAADDGSPRTLVSAAQPTYPFSSDLGLNFLERLVV